MSSSKIDRLIRSIELVRQNDVVNKPTERVLLQFLCDCGKFVDVASVIGEKVKKLFRLKRRSQSSHGTPSAGLAATQLEHFSTRTVLELPVWVSQLYTVIHLDKNFIMKWRTKIS